MSQPRSATFGYYINLDERGSFFADVRDDAGETIFEIRCEGDDFWIFEDGWMESKLDVDGLADYMVDLGLITRGSTVLLSHEFEARNEMTYEEDALELDF